VKISLPPHFWNLDEEECIFDFPRRHHQQPVGLIVTDVQTVLKAKTAVRETVRQLQFNVCPTNPATHPRDQQNKVGKEKKSKATSTCSALQKTTSSANAKCTYLSLRVSACMYRPPCLCDVATRELSQRAAIESCASKGCEVGFAVGNEQNNNGNDGEAHGGQTPLGVTCGFQIFSSI
jgi:hypothetical protein